MKAPQEWNAVKGAMSGVLREIGDDNRQRQLDEKRQASYGVASHGIASHLDA